ncbi:hypothetical protein Tco_0692308 [Tanacetum coccineum]
MFLSKCCLPARIAKKMEEINNFQQEPDENLYQAWEQFKELLMKCPQHYLMEMQEVVLFYNRLDVPTQQILDSRGAIPSKTAADAKVAIQEMAEYSQKWHNGTSRTRSPHYTKDCPLKEEGKTLEEAYYTQFGAPFQGGGYRATAPGFYQRNNTNPSYQERRQSMEETLSKFMGESAKRHKENSNLIKEIRASTDAAIRNQRASIKTLEIQIGQMSKVLQETGFGSLPSSTKTNPRDHVKSISTTIKADASSIRRKEGLYGPQFSKTYSYGASHIDNSIPQKEKDPGSFTLPCYINNVCFDNAFADLGASDIKVPLILKRLFLPTACANIDVFKKKITLRVREERIIFKSVKPASSLIKRVYMLSLRERMELDLETRLIGETLVLNRSLNPLNGDYIELNDLNVPLELRRDQVDDLMPTIEEGEVVEEFRARNDARMVSEIFGYPSDCDHDKKIRIDYAYNLKFSCMIVLEDMDGYHDEGMGDVIFGEPFLREVRVKARRFDGMITIYNGNESVTYQMVLSHPRFKHHTNKQCNKIPPILKVIEEDKMNEISHSYQKLNRFYKGVLNLGPDFIRVPVKGRMAHTRDNALKKKNRPMLMVNLDLEILAVLGVFLKTSKTAVHTIRSHKLNLGDSHRAKYQGSFYI